MTYLLVAFVPALVGERGDDGKAPSVLRIDPEDPAETGNAGHKVSGEVAGMRDSVEGTGEGASPGQAAGVQVDPS
ncbi:hypothetical protein ACTMTF_45810 [Nonomuraea sp. ZG12]|uniref:hypothetical protein n=1 Tax=Nonomuraea sp. ZG12 TaxID=3452207 RepID=UPI003F8A8A46